MPARPNPAIHPRSCEPTPITLAHAHHRRRLSLPAHLLGQRDAAIRGGRPRCTLVGVAIPAVFFLMVDEGMKICDPDAIFFLEVLRRMRAEAEDHITNPAGDGSYFSASSPATSLRHHVPDAASGHNKEI
ncbi:uncharacterized protein [Miscanthus floridulus]|uniref:uncharacterized protein isoform X2 n=1 Tax=Miscanthus floridulus TaxID=154761 RepID=UPI0034583104